MKNTFVDFIVPGIHSRHNLCVLPPVVGDGDLGLWWWVSCWPRVNCGHKTRPCFTPTQPWSGLVSSNWPRPSSSRCHGSVTIEVWPLWLGTRNGAFNLAELCPAHLKSISAGLCCHRQRLSGGPHQRLHCKKVGGLKDFVRLQKVKEFRKQL